MQCTRVHNKCPRYPGEKDMKGSVSFSFGVVNLFEFICLVSLGGALSVCRAWQWFSEHDWWVRANSVFLVLRTFPSDCGIQVLPGGEGKKSLFFQFVLQVSYITLCVCSCAVELVFIVVFEHLCVCFNRTNENTDWSRQGRGTELEGDVAGDVWDPLRM